MLQLEDNSSLFVKHNILSPIKKLCQSDMIWLNTYGRNVFDSNLFQNMFTYKDKE